MKKIKFSLLAFFILCFFTSFSTIKIPLISYDQGAKQIGSVWLDYGTTTIFLSDYVLNCNIIDSVTAENRQLKMSADKRTVEFTPSKSSKNIIELKIWNRKRATSVILKKSPKIAFNFMFEDRSNKVGKVEMSGEFNGWTPSKTNLSKSNGIWQTQLILSPGEYQYQLVVDGNYILDPANTKKVSNNMGGFNSLLKVGYEDKSESPLLISKSYSDNKIEIEIKNNIDEIIILWQNKSLEPTDYKIDKGVLTINLPDFTRFKDKSYLYLLASNKSGISNDLIIPLEQGKVIAEPNQLARTDDFSKIIYNVFVDRFYNGNKNNDRPVKDSLILPRANYLGGDIKGIEQKINDNYFNDLGINTLWLSPLVKNPEGAFGEWKKPYSKFSAYHGYWPISFTEMDNRLGSNAEFTSMVESGHQRKLNTLLDFVAHHVHEQHPVYKQHPDWTTSLYLPDGSLNTEKWDEYRLTTWFDVFLPTLDLAKPEVAEMLADSATWWLKEYKLDGFRHDATKHVPLNFWRTLTEKIKTEIESKEGNQIYQVGETYGSVELIGSYLGNGMLDGQFDFNVYDAALGAFARGDDFGMLKYRLNESMTNYGYHNKMCYITGNQDRGRFISYAGGSLKFEENAKEAGWTREISVGDPIAYKKLQMLMAFNMTIPGIPVIYYGDEFGMPGGNDPDSRRMMRFGNELNPDEAKTLQMTKKLSNLRKNNMALMFGSFIWLENSTNVMAYVRTYFNKKAIVLFNNSNTIQTYKIEKSNLINPKAFRPHFGNSFNFAGDNAEVELKPMSFEILINEF